MASKSFEQLWAELQEIAARRPEGGLRQRGGVDLDDPPGARRGIFGLQIHAGGPMEVRFKDLKLEVNPVGRK